MMVLRVIPPQWNRFPVLALVVILLSGCPAEGSFGSFFRRLASQANSMANSIRQANAANTAVQVDPSLGSDDILVSFPLGPEGEERSAVSVVKGLMFEKHREFLGIPFAHSTRFEMPTMWSTPLGTEEVPFDATKYGPHVSQLKLYTKKKSSVVFSMFRLCKAPVKLSKAAKAAAKKAQAGGEAMSPSSAACNQSTEHALNLNIYTPKGFKSDSQRYPVMVFVPGGSLTNTGNSMPLYNPRNFVASQAADEKVVVVTVQYRVGPFGFAALPVSDANVPTGNYGLFDVIEALRWTRKNIGAFGGDPNSITLTGFSAGSILVNWVQLWAGMNASEANGLFHRVYMMSGTFRTLPPRSFEEATRDTIALAQELKCPMNSSESVIGCLKDEKLTDQEIILACRKLKMREVWAPVIDLATFCSDPSDLISRGHVFKVPTLITTTKDDGSAFAQTVLTKRGIVDPAGFDAYNRLTELQTAGINDEATRELLEKVEMSYKEGISRLFNKDYVSLILDDYKLEGRFKGNLHVAISTLLTDAVFKCPALEYGVELNGLDMPVYYHEFSSALSTLKVGGMFNENLKRLGIFHGADLALLFGFKQKRLVLDSVSSKAFRQKVAEFMKTGKFESLSQNNSHPEDASPTLIDKIQVGPKIEVPDSCLPFLVSRPIQDMSMVRLRRDTNA